MQCLSLRQSGYFLFFLFFLLLLVKHRLCLRRFLLNDELRITFRKHWPRFLFNMKRIKSCEISANCSKEVYHMTSTDPLTSSYIIWPASWRERVWTGLDGLTCAGPEKAVRTRFNIFTLCTFFKNKIKWENKWAHRKANFTIQKNFQMPSYWDKQLLFKTLIESQVTANLQGTATDEHCAQCTKHNMNVFQNYWVRLAKKGKCGAFSSLTNYSVACT